LGSQHDGFITVNRHNSILPLPPGITREATGSLPHSWYQ
jgi:hypothetical protein